tara:strand:- start:1074 stop:1748 length:675 start_codon:yes stop_codon:yes gene_type:complete
MLQLIDKKNKIIIYLLLLFILSTTSGKYSNNQKNYPSKINQINIKGLSSVNNSEISNKLNSLFYRNILLVKKEEIQSVLSKYNIIEEYNVKIIYPSTINISIKPTKFIARLSINDQLVGANGKLIENKKNIKISPDIFGKFISKDFLVFKKNIEQSNFTFTEFKTLYFFPSNRWDILTNNNILIKLPQDNFLESLNLAYKIINNKEFTNQNLIDLRVNNHLILK